MQQCRNYKQIYDRHWNDLHSSVPTPTSNSLTTEKPTTTTAEQAIPTPDKPFQGGVQQQQPTGNTPIQSSSIPGLFSSTTDGSPDNSGKPTDKSDSGNRAQIDARRLSVPQKSETSGQEKAGTPSINNPTTINPTTSGLGVAILLVQTHVIP
jgi:hypothetical protein